MTFEDFLTETSQQSQELAVHSHQLASQAKSTSAEMQHDRAARTHQQAAAKKREHEEPHQGTGI